MTGAAAGAGVGAAVGATVGAAVGAGVGAAVGAVIGWSMRCRRAANCGSDRVRKKVLNASAMRLPSEGSLLFVMIWSISFDSVDSGQKKQSAAARSAVVDWRCWWHRMACAAQRRRAHGTWDSAHDTS
ncbi:glycine zipper domain-containing protein [Pseudoduganella sp. LjRoot289]|uniref:glycine zipper domain-containing protein n=1 Tax=Pseudoduganella sp. LjRoot289 TaxID=3342314 RepID=UPI003F4FA752